MKKYLFLSTTIGALGGGQLYVANKVKYLEKLGYKVFVFTYYKELIVIPSLTKYQKLIIPELEFIPQIYFKKKVSHIVNKILEKIDFYFTDDVIIESNRLDMSLWGELVARNTNGKHFIFSISERNIVKPYLLTYLEFKYSRSEIATINPDYFKELYNLSHKISYGSIPKFIAYMGEQTLEYHLPALDNIRLFDKNVCLIGRDSKAYMEYACLQLSKFAMNHPETKFSITIISSLNAKKRFGKFFINHKNIELNFLGELYPIPLSVFKMFDLYIAGAGSAFLAYSKNALTLSINVQKDEPIGLMGYEKIPSHCGIDGGLDIQLILEDVLYIKKYQNYKFTPSPVVYSSSVYDKHIELLKKSSMYKEFYRIQDIKLPIKAYISIILRKLRLL